MRGAVTGSSRPQQAAGHIAHQSSPLKFHFLSIQAGIPLKTWRSSGTACFHTLQKQPSWTGSLQNLMSPIMSISCANKAAVVGISAHTDVKRRIHPR